MSRIATLTLVLLFGIFCRFTLAQNEKASSEAKRIDAEPSDLKRFEVSHPLMGVKFRFAIYAPNVNLAQRGLVAAVDRIKKLEDCMSDYDPDSEISKLCRRAKPGIPVKVSEDLFKVLLLSDQIWKKSMGSFDPTIGPLSKLWREAHRGKKIPGQNQIDKTKDRVGWENLVLNKNEKSVTFNKSKMELDLGGIAKGYAADEAIRVLKKMGLSKCLVDAGGDVTVGDAPPNKKGWTIAIANTRGRKLIVTNASVATSGDRYQFLEKDGKRYSHIIHPKTGWGMTDRRLVTVVSKSHARTGAWADGWASALSVISADCLNQSLTEKIKVAGIQIQRIDAEDPKEIDSKIIFETGVLKD